MDAEHPAVAPRPKRGKRRKKGGGIGFQHRFEYVFVRIFGLFLRRLPIGLTSAALGTALGFIMPLTARHRRALDNLAYAIPQLTDAERQTIARTMWRNLGRVSAEAFQIDKLIEDPQRVELPEDFEKYRGLCREGVIAATAHLGNWEIAGTLPRIAALPFAGVYQALHNPLVEDYLKAMRMPAYPAGLFAKGPRLGQTLVRLAREGKGVGMVADFRELRGVPVTFFGQRAYATPLPAMLARLSGKPLLAGAILRTEGVHFRVILKQISVPSSEDRDADIRDATQRLHDAFEEWIRCEPAQWMWIHRKWARPRA
ncbi:MAG: lauroyl acyltransferase [Pseudomonadota bacterium]